MNSLRNTEGHPALLLTAREAAQALAISERTLWTLTARGEITCIRIGRAVRYSAADLAAWIESRKAPFCGARPVPPEG
jgi:excisionase family DNA binding protein